MKISVVTVCFNSEKTLERTIQSFIAQDYPDKELVIIDGGSKDGTKKLIEKHRSSITVLVSEPDRGIYDAMNKGWQKATGDFVHFLNSDDWYVNSSVLSDVAAHLKDKNTIYHGRLVYQHDSGLTTSMGRHCGPEDLKFELRGIHQPATFFPRSLFEKWGGFDISYRISSDYELIRRFVNKAPTQFIEMDIVYMSDAGASAKQIETALKENHQIAMKYGESFLPVYLRSQWVHFWLKVRYDHPSVYKVMKKLKDKWA